MKQNFINGLMKNAVRQKDFAPLMDENGEIYHENGVYILAKNSFGVLYILEIIDGDALTAEDIQKRLDTNKRKLHELREVESNYIIELFVFENQPEQDKLEAISVNGLHQAGKKKFLKSLSLDMSSKKLVRHYKTPFGTFGLGGIVKKQLEEPLDESENIEDIKDILAQKEEELKMEFKAKNPIITYGLIVINILVFIALNIYSTKSGTDYNSLLGIFGQKDNSLIINGEYWRFISPMFLHGGKTHVALNCLSLYMIGIFVERSFGHFKFAVVYFIAGFCGSIMSFMFSTSPSVGASGAIFGLMGALLYFGLQRPTLFRVIFGYNVIVTIVINLLYGFITPGIDNFGHIGGLIGGFIASGAVMKSDKVKWYLNRVLYIVLLVTLMGGGLYYGFNNKNNKALLMIEDVEQYIGNMQWIEAEEKAEEILSMNSGDKLVNRMVLWDLIVAELSQKKFDECVEHAQQLKKIDKQSGHYLLGATYFYMNKFEDARNELLEAKRLKADYAQIDKMLEMIDKVRE